MVFIYHRARDYFLQRGDQMDAFAKMKKFMEPESVALVGISSRVGKGALNIMENLMRLGFVGGIFPVNPNIKELLGQKVFPDVLAISDPIDLAVIMTPRNLVPDLLDQCAQKGIDSVLIITQGFAEADEEGRNLQLEIDRKIMETGIHVLGPNSIGIINHFISFSTSFVPIKKEESPIALISQSGGFLEGFSQFKVGKGIDLGNACDIDFADALAYFEDDPSIRVIGLYIESIKNGEKFLEIAKRVARKKFILALKAGRSKKGAEALSSHSASLAGEEAVYEAVFRKAGIIPIRNVEEFGDISKAFLSFRPVNGDRIGIVTPTGAGGILVLDASEEYGFKFASLSEEHVNQLKSLFLPWQKVSNPLDIMSAALAHGYKHVYTKALEVLFNDPAVDIIFCVLGDPTLKTVAEMAKHYPQKPLVAWTIGQPIDTSAEAVSVASYPTPERGLRSLEALVKHNAFLMKPPEETKTFPINRKLVEKVLKMAKKRGQKLLPNEAFSLLRACGIPVAPSKMARTKKQAVEAAEALEYPVVLKIYSPEILHKSDVSGVRVGIRNSKELRSHYEEMISEVFDRVPHATIKGVMIQKMVTDGRELILGGKRDPQFGPVIIFGWGGVYTELLKDFSCGIPPMKLQEAEEMISFTKVSKVLRGFRGELPSDRVFIKECILRLSQLVSEFPEIKEVDINPLKVFPKGGVAIDVRAVIQ
jgi:acyl-CoA synthetase (NDP forming)